MNFYFTIYQMIETSERLEGGMKYLAAHALSTSPRDGQANRALLEQCGDMLQGVRELLTSKSHISKVQLRRTAILFQALEIAHRRVLHLAGAALPDDEGSLDGLWGLLCHAKRDYRDLRAGLGERMGTPLYLELSGEDKERSFREILQKESALQEELLKLIERAIEVFGEESELISRLTFLRKGLLEERKNVKRLLVKQCVESEPALLAHRLDPAPT